LCFVGASWALYYTSPSCAATVVAGCKAYTNPTLTNLVTDVGYVGKQGSTTYYAYTNPGPANNHQATGTQQTCPSPSPTPSVTPSITPSITPTRSVTPTPTPTPSITPTPSVTPTPTPSPVTCYSQGSFEYVSSIVDCQVGSYPYTFYSPCGSLSIGCYLYANNTCTGSVASSYVQFGDGTNYQTDGGGQIIDIYNPGC
jgi:hypothetical protein